MQQNLSHLFEAKEQPFYFLLFLVSAFIFQTGMHFYALALSASYLIQYHSATHSAAIIVFSYVPAALFSNYLGSLIDKKISIRFIVIIALLTATSTLICSICVKSEFPIAIICIALSLRSLCWFIIRTSLSKILKMITPSEFQKKRLQLFYFTFFLSTAMSGLLVSELLSNSVFIFLIVEMSALIIGLIFLTTVQPIRTLKKSAHNQNLAKNSFQKSMREIAQQREILLPFLFVISSQAIFQGAYMILVSYLPIQHLQLSSAGVGKFQIAASLGIIAGFLLIWRMPKFFHIVSTQVSEAISLWMFTLCLGILILIGISTSLITTLILFFCMNFVYECIWLHYQSNFFSNSPAEAIARYQFILNSLSSLTMGCCSFYLAFLLGNIRFFHAIIVYVSSLIFLLALLFIMLKSNKNILSSKML